MWRILQCDTPSDYVIGTGISYSVRQFTEFCFDVIGVKLEWKGHGADEKGYDAATGALRVVVDPSYYRPLEVERLRANPARATSRLGWQASTLAPALAKIMVRYDLAFDDYGEPDSVSDEAIAKRWRVGND